MRTFAPPAGTRFYAGVDLHARAIFVVVLDHDGGVDPDAFLRAVAPFRDGLLVACVCMHFWYWLADACRDHRQTKGTHLFFPSKGDASLCF